MADQNINNMTVVWNSGGTTFNAIKMNVTDTASAVASALLLLQVGGSDKFKVGKDGTITGAGGLSIAGSATITGNLTVSGTLSASGISGAVTGPAGATANAIARFNGTTGGIIKNSGATLDDTGVIDAVGYKQGGVSLTLLAATAAQYRANTASLMLTTDKVWSAAGAVALADAATIAVDMSTFINATVTLGGNRALGQPSNAKVGQSGVIEIVQDGTGGRTLGYHADWFFAGGADPVLSTAAGARDLLFYHVLASGKTFASLIKAVA